MINIINKVLKIFADNKLFDEGVELIGSWCFQMYRKHLKAKSFPLRTQDIDFLIPNPFHGKEHHDFIEQLKEIGFKHDFNSDGSLYLWNADLKIEFVTPEKGRGTDKAINIAKIGIRAMPLRFVTLLLNNPIKIKEKGIVILLPNPMNFCLHKLLIASRRRRKDKKIKDLQQAICTSVIVNSAKMNRLFKSLPKKWQQTIIKMLEVSKKELPVYDKEIEKLGLTLQEIHK